MFLRAFAHIEAGRFGLVPIPARFTPESSEQHCPSEAVSDACVKNGRVLALCERFQPRGASSPSNACNSPA
jgi:hypothetical protein